MRPLESLKHVLAGIDGKDYMAYQALCGQYKHDWFDFFIDSIPKDPYAPPHNGVYRARVYQTDHKFSQDLFETRIKRIAFCDFLARCFYENCKTIAKSQRGTGNSGLITIAKPGQEILERTSVVVNAKFIEARFFMGLPAKNRAVNAAIAQKMIFEELPEIIERSLYSKNTDLTRFKDFIQTAEDSVLLRNSLSQKHLVSFIPNGAVLPRRSSINSEPLENGKIIRFKSPPTLEMEFDLPNKGKIRGMGIPEGVSLIVGGGYHGKSTLLDAISLGVYNFIPGDGREFCVTIPEAVKVRAQSGRFVCKTDISAFINSIPFRESTEFFSTDNASGSTSQAASISEAIEVGANVLLMDEDTCAANFMIRDYRMQKLVAREDEPITAFADLIRPLYEKTGISTIIVMGGSGDYFDVCDTVIQMKEYLPVDVTTKAQEIAANIKTGRITEISDKFNLPRSRIPDFSEVNPLNNYGHFRITASDRTQLVYGQDNVSLTDVEQLVEKEQLKGIGRAIYYLSQKHEKNQNMKDLLQDIIAKIEESGLDILDKRLTGNLSAFRISELVATLNRMRSLKISSK